MKYYYVIFNNLKTENFSLQTGEIFEVLDDELSGHFKIRTQCGQIGFISPTNFRCSFSLSKTGWYLPNVSRKQAAEMLSDKNRPIGSFLVRNDFNLSLQTFFLPL